MCPFDTQDSNFVKVLEEFGFDVTYSHINTGTDFFDISLDGYDAVVSNPPFSKRQMILERLFDAEIPFALVMNFNGLFDQRNRWEMFRTHKFELLIPCGRWHFIDVDGVECKSPNFQSIYVCSKMAEESIEFIMPRSTEARL